MKRRKMNKLIYADDLVKRDKKQSLAAWICDVSGVRVAQGKMEKGWNGKSVGGAVVQVLVANGRVLAKCDQCGGHEYVSAKERIFFCMECGNGNSGEARPVEFPQDWDAISAALIARPIFPGPGLDEVQAVFRSRPVIRELKRNWSPEIELAQLIEENNHYGLGGTR
jgi:ribosomal protein L37E